ncbi:hypothetical protein BKI52_13080 [marine bacterium AO1-C]|nr:hypothetical protein BKI52_13080 [marine bacterium AO1-C]
MTMEKNYRNLGFIFLLLIPIMLLGFFSSYLSKLVNSEKSIHFLIHLHFWVSTTWVVLMILQPLLIRFKRPRLHKKLGKFSYVLFVLFNLTLVPFIIGVTDYVLKGGSPTVLVSTLFNVVLVNIFFILAMVHRKNIALHMRYMIALALVFLFPPIGRIVMQNTQNHFLAAVHINYTLVNLILVGLIFLDRANQRSYRPYAIALVAFILNQVALHASFSTYGLM